MGQSRRVVVSGAQKCFQQIAFQTHQNGLGFRVAHAAVEFQHLELSLGANHQACIQKTGVWNAIGLHALEGGLNHLAHDPRMHFRCHHGCRRVRAHATGVGALVVVQQTLVVLRGGQGYRHQAMGDHHETGFFTF